MDGNFEQQLPEARCTIASLHYVIPVSLTWVQESQAGTFEAKCIGPCEGCGFWESGTGSQEMDLKIKDDPNAGLEVISCKRNCFK